VEILRSVRGTSQQEMVSVIITERLAASINEMDTGTGRAPQGDVGQPLVGWRIIVEPRLHVQPGCRTLIKYGSHGFIIALGPVARSIP
jgi:hypothetical protein